MKAVIYARVSSKDQEKEGYSIPAQKKLLKEYAHKNNFKIVKEFIDVETAKKSGRENFGLMVDFLKNDKTTNIILVEKTDRLYRNFTDYIIIDELYATIHLVKENEILSKKSKSHTKFIHGIKVLMAKNYIDNLSEEASKGMREKAEQGIYPSCAPIGYVNCAKNANGRTLRYLKPDKIKAPLINNLFELYATGNYSLSLVVERGYNEGLRNRNGGKVGKSAIHKILRNPIYYGEFRWNGVIYSGSHTPIITKELFKAVQDIFNAQNKPKQTKRQFAYTGLLVCGQCGCAITAEIKKNKYVYYHCTKFKGTCNSSYIREEILADKLSTLVKRININNKMAELIKNSLAKHHSADIKFHTAKTKGLNIQKTKLENRLRKAYLDKLDGKTDEEFYNNFANNYNDKLNQIKQSLEDIKNNSDYYLKNGLQIIELCNKAYPLYLQQNHFERAQLLRYILSNCSLNDVSLCPIYRKPFDLFAKRLSRTNWLPREDSYLQDKFDL